MKCWYNFFCYQETPEAFLLRWHKIWKPHLATPSKCVNILDHSNFQPCISSRILAILWKQNKRLLCPLPKTIMNTTSPEQFNSQSCTNSMNGAYIHYPPIIFLQVPSRHHEKSWSWFQNFTLKTVRFHNNELQSPAFVSDFNDEKFNNLNGKRKLNIKYSQDR